MEIHRLMESESRLQAFKRENGLTPRAESKASGYILFNRVKKYLADMNEEHFKAIRAKHMSRNSKYHKDLLVHRYEQRADKLPVGVLQYMAYVREEDGLGAFFELFRMTNRALADLSIAHMGDGGEGL